MNALCCGQCGTKYGKHVQGRQQEVRKDQDQPQPAAPQPGPDGTAPATSAAVPLPAPPIPKKITHHDVFISYSSKDKPIADAVCATLERYGVRCWIAPRDILPGEDFPKAIINAINDSIAMVLIFSASANASPQVTREVTKAVSKGIMIIPFRIENAPMSESMEYLIGLPHWMDALSAPMDEHIAALARRLKNLVDDHQ
jgi:hypothetical protein